MAGTGGVGINVGYGHTSGSGSDNSWFYSPDAINQLLYGSMNSYLNSGALSDMIMGGGGFGRSRNYNQYRPDTRNWNGSPEMVNTYGDTGSAQPPVDRTTGIPSGTPAPPGRWDSETGLPPGSSANDFGSGGNYQARGLPPPDMSSQGDPSLSRTVDGGSPATGQRPAPPWHPGYTQYQGWGNQTLGNTRNDNFAVHDNAPEQGQGLLGGIANYDQWNDIENRLKNDLGWQATGDLMDLESRSLSNWENFRNPTNLEKDLRQDINWQRSGDLSDLEQQEKHGFANYAKGTALENDVSNAYRDIFGSGQHDALRGKTLTGMVEQPGFSTSEKSALKASQLLPIQQALEAQRLTGDARQAATGNQAGRWGASNAMALGAAGQAAQAGRNVELDSAQMMRQDRAQGLEGLGGLQGQIDARKAQGAQGLAGLSGQQRQAGALSLQGLSNLAGKQRANQQFGINAGMGLNDTQRNALATSNQAIGQMGQQQRANTQWGLGALSGLNEQKKNQELTKLGLTKDIYDTTVNQGQKEADRAAQLASLVRGQTYSGTENNASAGISY